MSKLSPSQTALILTLPSHVTVLFITILGVVWMVLIAGLNSGTSNYAMLMLFLSVILPLRHLFTWVDRARAKMRCQPDPILQIIVDDIARDLGLNPPPRIEQAAQPVGIHAIGGLRRRIIVGGANELATLQRSFVDPTSPAAHKARAILIHEMQHFLRHDTRYLELTRYLLLTCGKWAGWVTLMSLCWYLTLGMYMQPAFELVLDPNFISRVTKGDVVMTKLADTLLQQFLPPRIELEKVLTKIKDLNFALLMLGSLFNMLPFIVSGVLLWRFVYHRMLHVREHYADLGAAIRSSPDIVAQAILDVDTQNATTSSQIPFWQKLKRFLPKQPNFGFRYHPSSNERRWALRNPVEALTDPVKNGNTIGFILLCLYMVLTSGFSVTIIGTWVWHFGVLMGFIAVATMLTPAIIIYSFTHTWQLALTCIRRVVIIGFSWILINILMGLIFLLINPNYLFSLLEATAKGSVGIPFNAPITDEDVKAGVWHTVWGTLITLPLAVVALYAGLWLDLQIKKAILPHLLHNAKQLNRLCWGITLTITTGLFFALTVITALVMLDVDQIFMAGFLLFISLFICIGGSLCLLIIHQKLKKRLA